MKEATTPNQPATPAATPAPTPAPVPEPTATPTPAATPAPAETPPKAPTLADDPIGKAMLAGLGLAVGEPAAPAAAGPAPLSDSIGPSLSDTLKFNDERRALEAAKPAPAPEPAKPGEPAAAPATPAPAAATDAPATPAAPAAKPAAEPEKPIEVEARKPIDKLVSDAVEQSLSKRFDKPAEPAAPAAPAQPAADPFEAELSEAEREELELARYAAKTNPDKYKDLPAKMLGFFKKTAAYVQQATQANPERALDDTDTEFRNFVRANKPAFSPVERKKIERQFTIDAATEQAKKDYETKLAEQERKIYELETKPRVEAVTQKYVTESARMIAEDATSPAAPIVKRALEVGWDAVLAEDRVFAPIVKSLQDQSARLAATYESVVAKLTPFAPDKDPEHAWLHQFVTRSADYFAQHGGEARVRDGRTFLSPKDYNALPAEKLDKHWTFNDRDVLERLAANTRANINQAIQQEEQRLTASGFKREVKPQLAKPATPAPAAPPAPAAAPTPAPVSVRSTPGVAPGASSGATPAPANPFKFVVDTLGLPVR